MFEMNNLKNNSGITLVALVTTVIIMLILAGVAITSLTGDEGLFEQSENSVEAYNQVMQSQLNSAEEYKEQVNEEFGDLSTPTNSTPLVPDMKKTDGTWNATKGVNSPHLASGMIPIYFDESGNPVQLTDSSSIEEWEKWYDYKIQTGSTSMEGSGTSKWANAQTQDGSYWVWIPRYAYQIKNNWHYYDTTNKQGEIDVVFIDKANKNGVSTYSTNYPTISNIGTPNAKMDDFVVHPAFTWGTTALSGIWVGKFEASQSDASSTDKNFMGTSNIIKIQPGRTSWRNISNNDIFTNCKNMANTSNPYGFDASDKPHMMKNIEWGAVAYLSQSKYGRNMTKITINNNSNYITGTAGDSVSASESTSTINSYATLKGMLASTTGNIYGIYDMSGGTWERTAAYIDNNTVKNDRNNTALVNEKNLAYKDVYVVGTNDIEINNYNANAPRDSNNNLNATGKFGDAIYETSLTSVEPWKTSWNANLSHFPYSSSYTFGYGGEYRSYNLAGVFFFDNSISVAEEYDGFRVVCLVESYS